VSTRRTSRRLIPFEMLGSSPSSVGPRLREGGGGGAEAPDVGDSLRLRIVSSAILRSLRGVVGRRDSLRVRGIRRREGGREGGGMVVYSSNSRIQCNPPKEL